MCSLCSLVEVTGLEPAASCSQSKRATIAPHLVILLTPLLYQLLGQKSTPKKLFSKKRHKLEMTLDRTFFTMQSRVTSDRS